MDFQFLRLIIQNFLFSNLLYSHKQMKKSHSTTHCKFIRILEIYKDDLEDELKEMKPKKEVK